MLCDISKMLNVLLFLNKHITDYRLTDSKKKTMKAVVIKILLKNT